MPTTNVLPWLRSRRIVALIAALALVVSMALASNGNSWGVNAAPEDPAEVVVDADVAGDEDMILAGPSWTYSSRISLPPVSFFGPSWG